MSVLPLLLLLFGTLVLGQEAINESAIFDALRNIRSQILSLKGKFIVNSEETNSKIEGIVGRLDKGDLGGRYKEEDTGLKNNIELIVDALITKSCTDLESKLAAMGEEIDNLKRTISTMETKFIQLGKEIESKK
jgi:hypothetical protein